MWRVGAVDVGHEAVVGALRLRELDPLEDHPLATLGLAEREEREADTVHRRRLRLDHAGALGELDRPRPDLDDLAVAALEEPEAHLMREQDRALLDRVVGDELEFSGRASRGCARPGRATSREPRASSPSSSAARSGSASASTSSIACSSRFAQRSSPPSRK